MSAHDDWQEFEAPVKSGKTRAGCVMRGMMTRGKDPQRRLSLTLRLDCMPAEIATCLASANRFSCAFNERLGALRLRPNDQGASR